jgi:outer membrane protein assembly factor BamA
MHNSQQLTNRAPVPHPFTFTLLVALFACSLSLRAQQQPPAGKMKLAKVEVVGLQQLKPEDVIAASGLQVGEIVDVDALDAAAEKLLASGLVTKLAYKLRERNGEATVTFDVVEATKRGNLPVVFDNFVWFTPEEINAAIRKEVPNYDGTAPESSAVIENIRHALAELLLARKIQAEIEYLPATTASGTQAHHVFTAKGVVMPICAVSYPGASGVSEKELIDNSQSVTGEDYSHESVVGFADVALRRVYHERGFLRVKFGEPSARVSKGEGCGANGVAVAVPVEEGLQYNWGGATWENVVAVAPTDLDAALALKPGEVANELKIERALHEVERAYTRKGYLAVAFHPTPQFDDATRRVSYRFDVREGPQYRMGTLEVVGLPAADAERLKAKWKLRAGEVYDATYAEAFGRTVAADVSKPGTRPHVGINVKPDAQKLVADVTITVKFDSP